MIADEICHLDATTASRSWSLRNESLESLIECPDNFVLRQPSDTSHTDKVLSGGFTIIRRSSEQRLPEET